MELRLYQSDAIVKLRDRIKQGHTRVVMVLATGGGKTRIAAEIIRLATEKGKRVCFVCNRIELVKQAAAAFEKLGMKVGILQGMNTYNASAQIVVASIQTIVRRKAQDFDLYIIDECHGTAGSTAYHSLMYRNSNVVFVGLTATPWAKGMARKHKELNNEPLWHPEPVVAATIADLIQEGYLVDADCYAPGKPDLSGVRIIAGDYDPDELAKRSDTTKLVGDIVTHWIRLAEGRQTVVFSVNVAHSRHIVQCFNDRLGEGMAHHIDGYMTEEERRPLIDRFRAGEYPILSNCQMLQEGFDVPATTVVVLAKATRSLISFIQSCGRALRPHGEKTHALILDHAGNIERLGWPTETRDYTLNDGKPTEKKEQPENLPKVCPSCAAVYARSLKACPVCKFEPKSMPREQEVEAGELVQLSKKATKYSMEDKQRIYSALLGHAKLKGYHQGWAYHKFQEMNGHYPSNKMLKKEGPMMPEVEGFLKHKAIKWAKSQENFMRRAVIESARP